MHAYRSQTQCTEPCQHHLFPGIGLEWRTWGSKKWEVPQTVPPFLLNSPFFPLPHPQKSSTCSSLLLFLFGNVNIICTSQNSDMMPFASSVMSLLMSGTCVVCQWHFLPNPHECWDGYRPCKQAVLQKNRKLLGCCLRWPLTTPIHQTSWHHRKRGSGEWSHEHMGSTHHHPHCK